MNRIETKIIVMVTNKLAAAKECDAKTELIEELSENLYQRYLDLTAAGVPEQEALQQAMDQAYPSLTRPIQLSPERYNQHLTTGSLILEVGTCGNSLTEAVRAAELFAEAAAPVLRSLTGG